MSDLSLDDIDIGDIPADESVKLHGPPGTGKTTNGIARITHLVQNHGYKIGDVCWGTYRTSLASDVLQRLNEWGLVSDAELKSGEKGATQYIATMHAIGYRLMPSMPDPVQEQQINDFCNGQGIPYWGGEPWETTSGELLFRTFYWLKNNLYDPADVSDVREAPMYGDLVEKWPGVDVPIQWADWQAYKTEAGVIDFYEMLERPLEAGVAPPCPIVVIDEYHDAYPLMAALAELWIETAEVAIVAGDPNQVINDFDGASPSFFEGLDLPCELLGRSYRVPAQHMAAAEAMLVQAHDVPPVTPDHAGGYILEYNAPRIAYSADSGWDVPSRDTEGSPSKLFEEFGPDIMYLTRTRQQARGVAAALRHDGIPYRSQDGLNGWNTDKAATRVALYNALVRMEGVSPSSMGHQSYGLAEYTGEDAVVSPRVTMPAESAAELLRVTDAQYLSETRSRVNEIADHIEEGKDDSVTLVKIDEYVTPEFWGVYTQGAQSVSSLNKTGASQDVDDDMRRTLVAAINNYGKFVSNADELPTQVLTIHASKGQESEQVVLYDGITRTVARSMRDNAEACRNEYRTWYVALTRAKERLHLMRGAFDWTDEFLPEGLLETVCDALQPDGDEEAEEVVS